MTTPEVKGPVVALHHRDLFEAILRSLLGAQTAGDMPTRRQPPPGESILFWIGSRERLIGYAVVYETYSGVCWLDLFWIAPAHRGKGLGKHLMSVVTETAKQNRLKTMQFGTAPENTAMQGLGGLLGFRTEMVMMEREL